MEQLSLDDFTKAGTVIQIGVAPNRVDLLTSIDGVEFSDAWTQRADLLVEGESVSVIGRDHLIRNKLAVGRPQDRADIERLENVRPPTP